jgi:hypothetical protein
MTQKHKCTKAQVKWPVPERDNLVYITATALACSRSPSAVYFEQALKFMHRHIDNRTSLGLCCIAQNAELLSAKKILQVA